jgi:hypothetical protein
MNGGSCLLILLFVSSPFWVAILLEYRSGQMTSSPTSVGCSISILAVVAIIGLLLLVNEFLVEPLRCNDLRTNGIQAVAVIKGRTTEEVYDEGSRGYIYHVSYTYEVDGEMYSRRFETNYRQYSAFEQGTTIEINYDQRNFSHSILALDDPTCGFVGW